eukprot:s2316_g8.t1
MIKNVMTSFNSNLLQSMGPEREWCVVFCAQPKSRNGTPMLEESWNLLLRCKAGLIFSKTKQFIDRDKDSYDSFADVVEPLHGMVGNYTWLHSLSWNLHDPPPASEAWRMATHLLSLLSCATQPDAAGAQEPAQVNPNLSAMPRPCKRKLRPLSDDDSDGPDHCDAAQAASPAGRHAPGIGTARSTSGSPSSSESPQVPQKSGEDAEGAAEGAEQQTSPGKFEDMDEMGQMGQMMAGDQQTARKPARHRARRAAAKASSGESLRHRMQPIPMEEIIEPEAFELNLAYPKPRSKFVGLLWEFASPPTPMLAVDVD